MNPPANASAWTQDTHLDIDAPAARIWQLWADVAHWPRWNPGVAHVTLHGPFASGSHFDMQLPDDGPLLSSRLLDVRPNECFTDETAFEGVVVRVTHAIAPLAAGGVRVSYRIAVEGPNAADVGAAVSADFPAVLQSLKQATEAPQD